MLVIGLFNTLCHYEQLHDKCKHVFTKPVIAMLFTLVSLFVSLSHLFASTLHVQNVVCQWNFSSCLSSFAIRPWHNVIMQTYQLS